MAYYMIKNTDSRLMGECGLSVFYFFYPSARMTFPSSAEM